MYVKPNVYIVRKGKECFVSKTVIRTFTQCVIVNHRAQPYKTEVDSRVDFVALFVVNIILSRHV
jgi:hypothetical protein